MIKAKSVKSSLIHSCLLVTAFTAIVACSGSQPEESLSSQPDNSNSTQSTIRVHNDPMTDLSDQRRLSGVSHAIFVGIVQNESGNKKLGTVPETQFSVKVIQVLKGDIADEVIVNQKGGVMEGNNESFLYLAEGDSLVEVGNAYLFATRLNDTEGWYTAIPEFGHTPLPMNEVESMDETQSRGTSQNEPLAVTEMKTSIAGEIPFP